MPGLLSPGGSSFCGPTAPGYSSLRIRGRGEAVGCVLPVLPGSVILSGSLILVSFLSPRSLSSGALGRGGSGGGESVG